MREGEIEREVEGGVGCDVSYAHGNINARSASCDP